MKVQKSWGDSVDSDESLGLDLKLLRRTETTKKRLEENKEVYAFVGKISWTNVFSSPLECNIQEALPGFCANVSLKLERTLSWIPWQPLNSHLMSILQDAHENLNTWFERELPIRICQSSSLWAFLLSSHCSDVLRNIIDRYESALSKFLLKPEVVSPLTISLTAPATIFWILWKKSKS